MAVDAARSPCGVLSGLRGAIRLAEEPALGVRLEPRAWRPSVRRSVS